jgi:hypothetical protein
MDALNDDALASVLRALERTSDARSISCFLSCSKLHRSLKARVESSFLILSQGERTTTFRLNDNKWTGKFCYGNVVSAPIEALCQAAQSMLHFGSGWDESLVPRALKSSMIVGCLGGESRVLPVKIEFVDFQSGVKQYTIRPETVATQSPSLQLSQSSVHRMLAALARVDCRKKKCLLNCSIELGCEHFCLGITASMRISVEREYARGPRDNNDYFEYFSFGDTTVNELRVAVAGDPPLTPP